MNMNKGKIVQIIGPVVDVEFSGELPAIYNALTLRIQRAGPARQADARSAAAPRRQLGARRRHVTTEGLKRGYEVTDTGGPISMPVGEGVMGRVFNVTGDPWTNSGPVKADKYYPIHRAGPAARGPIHVAAGLDHRHQGH